MKYLKTYESTHVNFVDNSYYLVNGNMTNLIDIFKAINQLNTTSIIKQLIDGEYTKVFSFYISKHHDRFSFWLLSGERSEKEATDFYKKRELTYRGELKIVDNELILDTLELDSNKYNL